MLQQENLAVQNQDGQTHLNNDNKQDVSFAQLLKKYEPEPLHRGQYVQGEILQINEKTILADVDAKRTAVIPPQDIEKIEEEELGQLSVGDEVTLYVLRTPVGGEDLLVSLDKGRKQQDWSDAKACLADEKLLELEVIGHNKGGLMVMFGHLHGFVPTSHVPQLQHVYDKRQLASQKAKLVGTELPLKVIEVDRQNRRLVLSAKKAQKELRRQRLLELKLMEGQTITGRVTGLVKFGAFVDLDGIEGLIHISEIAWQKVEKPAEFLALGEEVDVLIKSVNVQQERISLSRKALLPSPWEQFAETHAPGDLVEAVVTNVVDFGAFALVANGIEGLIHISEMHGTRHAAPQEVLFAGDTILVRILKIQPQQERLALSQRRVSRNEEMEWTWQRQSAAALLNDEEE
ncbi:MAG: S1 RNA-binding domain-containing protein [Anaerolineae bacterium]